MAVFGLSGCAAVWGWWCGDVCAGGVGDGAVAFGPSGVRCGVHAGEWWGVVFADGFGAGDGDAPLFVPEGLQAGDRSGHVLLSVNSGEGVDGVRVLDGLLAGEDPAGRPVLPQVGARDGDEDP